MTDLDAIRARAEAATPGPWKRDPYDYPGMQVIARGNEVIVYHCKHPRQVNSRVVLNFDFIAHAREDIPALFALLDEKQAEIERLRDELRQARQNLLIGQQNVNAGKWWPGD